jgi:hypothetical protein
VIETDAQRARRLLASAALDEPGAALAAWTSWRGATTSWWLDPASSWWLPLVWWNIRKADIDGSDRAMLRQRYHDNWMRTEHLLALATPVVGGLEAAGIPTLLLKGAALATAVYERSGLRPIGDVDVLVPAHQAAAARAFLHARGWRPILRVAESSLAFRHGLGYTNGSGLDLDLHWAALGECSGHGTSDEGFWQRARTVSLNDVQTRVLAPSDQLLHLCVHGLRWTPVPTGHWRADAITLIRRAGEDLSWQALAEEARARRLSAQMIRALAEVRAHGGVVPPTVDRELARHRPARWESLEYRAKQWPSTLGTLVVRAWCESRRRRAVGGRGDFVRGLQAMAGAERSSDLVSMGAAILRRQDRSSRRLIAFGRRIRLSADAGSAPVLDAIAERLPPFARDRSGATPDRAYDVTRIADDGPSPVTYRVEADHRALFMAESIERVADLVVSDLQTFLVLTAPGATFLHAGVVCVDGRALILPGASGSGKSTLVAALVGAGGTYVSDEFAVLGGDGMVTPYPRPLVMRTAQGPTRVTAAALGATTARTSVRPAAIVFAPYAAGAVFAPAPVPPGDAALQLLRHCPGAHARSGEALAAVRALVSTASTWATPRGEAQTVVSALLALAKEGR